MVTYTYKNDKFSHHYFELQFEIRRDDEHTSPITTTLVSPITGELLCIDEIEDHLKFFFDTHPQHIVDMLTHPDTGIKIRAEEDPQPHVLLIQKLVSTYMIANHEFTTLSEYLDMLGCNDAQRELISLIFPYGDNTDWETGNELK